jgi:hypothetical protein
VPLRRRKSPVAPAQLGGPTINVLTNIFVAAEFFGANPVP